jgi:hypothetical protein
MADEVPPFETLAALAAQVADLRGDVVYVKARIERARLSVLGGLPGKVARLTADLDALGGQVETLAATLAEMMSAGPKAIAPTWVGLDEAGRAAQLATVTEWVGGVLLPSYGPVVKPCWRSHMAAVWELSTLAAEWRRVYQREAPELQGALDFHDHWLPGVTRRLGEVMRGCTADRCMAPGG